MKLERVFLTAALAAVACARSPSAVRPTFVGPPRAHQLLKAVEDAETSTRVERRNDIQPLGERTETVAAVVARGEVGPISLDGGRARLFGDAGGTQGWRVDNCVVFEVVEGDGKASSRFAVGYHDGLHAGSEQIDNFGRKSFQFGAGEVDITSLLPETGRFRLRVTALDTGNSGGVSDLFLVVGAGEAAGDDDLKGK